MHKPTTIKDVRAALDRLEAAWTDEDTHYLGEFEHQAVLTPHFSLEGESKFLGYGPVSVHWDITGLGIIIQQSVEVDDEQ